MVKGAIFITGATGLLGTEVAARLLTTTDCQLYVLVRASSTDQAVYRLQTLWQDIPELCAAIGERIKPVLGDMSQHLTLSLPDVTHVIHCAAETGLQKSRQELWRVNVEGTRNVVTWAQQLSRLQRFTYVSTAYVAGTLRGRVMEESIGTAFYSLYEQSKAEAEQIVRTSSLPFTICRPGMIVGNSQSGRTRNFNTVYYVLKLMLQGKLRVLPVSSNQTVNVVPVDYVAQHVADLTLTAAAEGRTFHLTASHADLPQVGQLVEDVRRWAYDHLHINVPRPLYLPLPLFRKLGRRYNAGRQAKSRSLLSNLTALMPYFLDDHLFDRSNTNQIAGAYHMEWRSFLPVLLTFACRQNFMRLSDQNIFQQAVMRRRSSHYPITYYNITAKGIERITGLQMNKLVDHFVTQLFQLGVHAGDRVALSGVNCAEHAAIDNAIGLVGAVSVPIYYTTPPDELALLLHKSGACCFFVGDERILQSAQNLSANIRLIRFGPVKEASASLSPTSHVADDSAQFTQVSGLNSHACHQPSALATIRYTSGTTGEPKGVMFNFYQLKWMGQVLTNLLSWRDRNTEMRYLSFLPMSHVVEGILAAYAPYCMLCKAKIYYLTDFQMLTKALPIVRPTVFFSVPRFYEKLWEQIEHNPLGKRYLAMSDGWLRRIVGSLLRRAALRKAGLDRCSQLLVGSAPMSQELLLRFRALGIEIHNAYGQTEAPHHPQPLGP